jgi:hypothetical protein
MEEGNKNGVDGGKESGSGVDVAQPPSYDDGHNSEEEETSEDEEEEEVIHTRSFPDLHTLDMTLPFLDHFPTSKVCKYVDV